MARAKRQETPAPQHTDYAVPATMPERQVGPDQSLRAPNFFFTHHPRAWEVVGDRVLPDLSKAPITAGVNGVEAVTEKGTNRILGWRLGGLREQLARSGKRAIPHSVDSQGGIPSYVRQPFPGFHCDRWTTMYAGSDRIDRDDESYNEWRASLVQRGVVDPPSYGALRGMVEIRRRSVSRLRSQAATYAQARPDLIAMADRYEREIEVLEKVLADTDRPAPGLQALPSAPAESLEL